MWCKLRKTEKYKEVKKKKNLNHYKFVYFALILNCFIINVRLCLSHSSFVIIKLKTLFKIPNVTQDDCLFFVNVWDVIFKSQKRASRWTC